MVDEDLYSVFYSKNEDTGLKIKDYVELFPLVFLAISLIVGIVIGETFTITYSLLLTLLLAFVVMAAILSRWRRLANMFSSIYLVITFLFGIFLTKWTGDKLFFKETNTYETFHAIVVSDPTEKADGAWMEAKVVDGRLEGKKIRLHIVYGTSKPESASFLGDCLKVKAKVRHPKNFDNSKFDYQLYLKSHGIAATATAYSGNWQTAKANRLSLSPIDNMKIYFLKKRRLMVEKLRTLGMDNQAFAVVAAMSLGDKSEVSRVTSNVYSLAGTSHVLALSGLHLSIVFGLFAIFGGTWRKSKAMVVFSLSAMWLYVLLAGSPVSMIRSAIMLTVSLLVGLSGRNGITLNTLSFAAILILLANPYAIHDISFQLSFAAVAFLGIFAGDISKIVPSDFQCRHRFIKWCWQLVVTSTVAQMGTIPLVAYHFGRLPLLFLPANFIAIPAATAILYLAVAFFLLIWQPWLSLAVGYALSCVTQLLNESMMWIASVNCSSIIIENMNHATVVLSYILAIVIMAILQYIGQSFSNRDRRSQALLEIHYSP